MNLNELLQRVDLDSVLETLPAQKKQELYELVENYERTIEREAAHQGFIPFVRAMMPGFIEGQHHKQMARVFERVLRGELKRVIINMPPRHSKSLFASTYLPAWFLGHFPDRKIIQCSHTAELAVGFGRQVRNILNDEQYREIFPGVQLSPDAKAAGRWNTNRKGEYFAIGVEGAVAGKGADLLIIDDPHSEQEAALAEHTPEIYDRVYEWYTSGPRQRLQPGGAIIVVATRWSLRDLCGQLIKRMQQNKGVDQWEVIELPAILPSGSLLWPEYWSEDEMLRTKASLPVPKWNAQYQQQPTSEEGALIKREWWKPWESHDVPPLECIMQSWDTAFDASSRADFTACTTWGVFYTGENKNIPNLILIDAIQGRWEFPDLKRRFLKHYHQHSPDIVIVEKKAAGAPLIYELRAMGIPVSEYTPTRGTLQNPNTKISRVNSITDIFSSGFVWYPDGRRWAEEVIEQCAAFPAGEHDDFVDTVVQALLRYRQGGWIRTTLDHEEPEPEFRRRREYY